VGRRGRIKMAVWFVWRSARLQIDLTHLHWWKRLKSTAAQEPRRFPEPHDATTPSFSH
jgi:hypothetical protein